MLRTTLLAGTVILGLTGVAAADYSTGMAAYNQGRYSTAFQEFTASANRGDGPSQYMLGRLYAEGRGTSQDFAAAYRWFDRANESGYTPDKWGTAFNATTPPPSTEATLTDRDSVIAVQTALNRKGFDAGFADGAFGPKTESAIRRYQEASGLQQTGRITPTLMTSLGISSGSASSGSGSNTGSSGSEFASGVTTSEIQKAERSLQRLGYKVDSVDGVVDTSTYNAVPAFQADIGATVDGRIDQDLLAQLAMVDDTQGPSKERIALVRQIEERLSAKGYKTGPVDGTLDKQTVEAIKAYQRDTGQAVNGKATPKLAAQLSPQPMTLEQLTQQLLRGVVSNFGN